MNGQIKDIIICSKDVKLQYYEMIVKRNKQQIDITLYRNAIFAKISYQVILDIPMNDKLLRLWLQFSYIYNIIYIIEKNPIMDLLQNVDDKRRG